MDIPTVAQLLGISRNAAYEAARTGQIPVLRIGRRVLVPTHKLRELLGVPTAGFDFEDREGVIGNFDAS